MKYIDSYFDIVKNRLNDLMDTEKSALNKVADKLSQVISNGGIVYLFGCGHSHIFSEDVFYRAGGLALVRPILIEPLMLHEGAARSSQLEKKNGYVADYLKSYAITDKDALIIVSTSGTNPVPVDVALWGKAHHAFTVAITSPIYAKTLPSKHDSGKYLLDCVDVVIDNKVPIGDAVLNAGDNQPPFAPMSSVTGIFIVHSIFAQVIGNLSQSSQPLPVFLSGNIPGSADHNLALLNKYGERIPELVKNIE